MAQIELVSKVKCFNGFQKVYKHLSKEVGCSMNFSVYEPIGDTPDEKFPVLFYLSGLTCSEQNFIQKSGFQKYASKHKLIVVGPDTSPRGLNLPGESDRWDFGLAAGCYLDALKEPWSKNYRMYSYVVNELPQLIKDNILSCNGKFSIFGHSMGGHGAITIGLRNPELFKSISAFAPICNPVQTEWGKTAFSGYLGEENKDKWSMYDSTEVIANHYKGPEERHILVDQGDDDEFLNTILLPQNLKAAADGNDKIKLTLNMRPGFNHSYFFISSFIEDHIMHHAKILNA